MMMMMRLAAFVVLFVLSQTICEARQVYCRDVGNKCDRDAGCKSLLLYCLAACPLMSWPATTCSQYCKDSYLDLLSNSAGRLWLECHNGLGDISGTFANAVSTKCFGDVKPTSPTLNQTRQPVEPLCSDVVKSCAVVSTCQSRYSAYLKACTSAFIGVSCSHQCNESYYNLLRHPVGSKFSSCNCGDDFACQLTGSSKLLPICYDGNSPVPPPTEAVPTTYPVGTCENVYERCYINNFGSCGSYVMLAATQCANGFLEHNTIPFTCPASCVSKLKAITYSIPYANDLLACRCLNSSSPMCLGAAGFRNITSLCGVTVTSTSAAAAATAATTTSAAATTTATSTAAATASTMKAGLLTAVLVAIGCILLLSIAR